jgi:hypothetical protein
MSLHRLPNALRNHNASSGLRCNVNGVPVAHLRQLTRISPHGLVLLRLYFKKWGTDFLLLQPDIPLHLVKPDTWCQQ